MADVIVAASDESFLHRLYAPISAALNNDVLLAVAVVVLVGALLVIRGRRG